MTSDWPVGRGGTVDASNGSHESSYLLSHHHPARWPNVDMDSRDSPSRLGKLMHRLREGKRKPDRTGAIPDGEEVYEAHSLLPHIVDVAEGRGPSREGNDAGRERVGRTHPPPSTSIPRSGNPDSMRARLLQFLPVNLIVPSDNGNTTAPYNVPEPLSHDTAEPSAVADGDKLNLETTVSSATKLLLRTTRESPDVFPPFKPIAGDLYTILENPEVWFTSRSFGPRSL